MEVFKRLLTNQVTNSHKYFLASSAVYNLNFVCYFFKISHMSKCMFRDLKQEDVYSSLVVIEFVLFQTRRERK